MIGNPLLLPDEGYNISRSVRLRSSASGYFTRTPGSSSGQQTFTISAWLKRGALSSQQVAFGINSASTNIFTVAFLSGDTFRVFGRNSGSDVLNITTTAVYRDPSSWYHIVVAIDTTQATAANRARLYVNGVEVTAFGTATYPSQNTSLAWNSSSYAHDIGRESTGNYFDGYLTEINHISGSQLTPSSFGETDVLTGVWKPKKYTGTYGTNGFFLNFSDNSNNTAATIGKDYSGNGNNWTPNNISVTSGTTYDSMLDVPTQWADGGNGRGNYAVLNPLNTQSTATLAGGNLNLTTPSTSYGMSFSTIGVSSGKYYWEVTVTSITAGAGIGINKETVALTQYMGQSADSYCYINTGEKYNNNTTTVYGATYTTNDVIGVAFDSDAGTLTFYKNNTSQGTAFSSLTGVFFPAVSDQSNGSASSLSINFGQRPFAYTPPSGFKALNTLNLPAPTILKGNQYFDALTWSGAGGSSRSITGLAFQPDLVWGKVRNTTYGHMLFDSARGAGSLKELGTNVTGAEGYASSNQYGYLSAFNSDGFTVTAGTDASIPNAYWNQSGNTYVGWQWKEGATQGFDIVTYTGNGTSQNISHSLGVAPKMIITKPRSNGTDGWAVYHASIGAGGALQLETTVATQVTGIYWNSTAPTSSVFSVGSANRTNGSGYSMVAYLFSEVAGFSRFGSYTGNGSADGPFVFCGFRPRWILVKRTDSTGNWFIWDTARDPHNTILRELYPDSSSAEVTRTGSSDSLDALSNGFKMRFSSTYADRNASGGTYIFAAFAESPFKNALAR
jgi:hypothetical protein